VSFAIAHHHALFKVSRVATNQQNGRFGGFDGPIAPTMTGHTTNFGQTYDDVVGSNVKASTPARMARFEHVDSFDFASRYTPVFDGVGKHEAIDTGKPKLVLVHNAVVRKSRHLVNDAFKRDNVVDCTIEKTGYEQLRSMYRHVIGMNVIAQFSP
jgi:hypothetical protein